MNEKNIENLKARLMQLGFAASVEMELRCRICFSPAAFELVHVEVAGADVARFVVNLQKGERDLYDVVSYQAVLRKDVVVPAELFALDLRMGSINWKKLTGNNYVAIEKADISEAFSLLKELERMGCDADVLKFKYWVDTPLEMMMANLSALKNRFEISERFYLFDAAHVISFQEAHRFLHSKWMEKQVVANKKLLLKKEEGAKGGGTGGQLLKKNVRKPGKGLHK